MSFHIVIRLIGMALFAAAGFFLGLYLSPIIYGGDNSAYNDLVIYLTLIGAIFGLLVTPYVTVYPVRWVRKRIRLMPPLDLVAMTLGLFLGLLMGALFAWPLSLLPGWLGDVAPTVMTFALAYLGIYIATQRKRDLIDTWKAERPAQPLIPWTSRHLAVPNASRRSAVKPTS